MKTNRIIITLICFMLGFAACAQTPSASSKAGKQTEVLVPGYKLFPTTNMWIFLKLDTSKGLVSMVHSGDDEVWTEGTKEMLDDMHKRKIDMADGIYVINVGGYIGQSTRSEIEYARSQGKSVEFLEEA